MQGHTELVRMYGILWGAALSSTGRLIALTSSHLLLFWSGYAISLYLDCSNFRVATAAKS
jgi:hypothetical protein